MLVLASRSPRRSELLRNAGFEFTVRVAEVDESPLSGESPDDYVQRLAELKAISVPSTPAEIVLAADTTVVLGGEIMGKPADREGARRMLTALAGRKHEVVTGICIRRGNQIIRDLASTAVWFAPLSEDEIRACVESGEPMDKAGAYAIQGLASRFIDRIDGSYTNVVGLPIALVYRRIREFGYYSSPA